MGTLPLPVIRGNVWLPCMGSSSHPSLFMSTRAPMAPSPLFLNCRLHYHHLPLGHSQLLPCAKKLECSLEICLGCRPIPRHLLLPSIDCPPLPVSIHSLCSTLSLRHGSSPSWPDTPAAGSHRQARDSLRQAPPLLLGVFFTKVPRTPRGQMLPNISKSPSAPLAGPEGARR